MLTRLLLFILVLSHLGLQEKPLVFEFLFHEPGIQQSRPPMLVMLHGYGANEEDLFDLAKTFDPRFKTFSLRAPYKIQEGGFAWFHLQRNQEKLLTYQYSQARESAAKVFQWIVKTYREQNLDSNRIYLLGFSQGAMLSYDIALSNPGRIKGVLALSGKLMRESRLLLKDPKKLKSVSVFIGHGNQDLLIPFKEAQEAHDYFKSITVMDLQLKSYPVPHSLSGDEISDIRKWFSLELDRLQGSVQKK